MRVAKVVSVLLLPILLMTAGPSYGASDFEKFFGHFIGTTMSDTSDKTKVRSSDVTIKPDQEGFNITWNTVSFRANETVKKSTFSINFRPSKQANIYGSAMSKDVFGHEKPLDPLNGDPYVWAHIDGDTLTVHSLLVAENGGYEIQTYERTLVDSGLALVFSRIQDGKIMKQFRGDMKRVD